MAIKSRKKNLLLALKLLVTGVFIYWLLTLSDVNLVWRMITSAPLWVILSAISMMVLALLIGSLRWWVLLRHTAELIRYTQVLPSYYLGVFFNNILPTTMGGDIVRTLHLSFRGMSTKALVGSAIIDRTVGLFTILVIGLVSIGLSSELVLERGDRLMLAGVATTGMAGIWLLFSTRFLNLIQHLATAYQHARVRKFLLETAQLCHSYISARGKLLAAVGLTVLMQSAVIVTYYILGKTVGITLSLLTYAGIIPLVFLAGAVPISLGGIGVREGALVGLLVTIGIDTQMAIALSLLYLFVLLASSLPGGLVMLFSRTSRNNSS